MEELSHLVNNPRLYLHRYHLFGCLFNSHFHRTLHTNTVVHNKMRTLCPYMQCVYTYVHNIPDKGIDASVRQHVFLQPLSWCCVNSQCQVMCWQMNKKQPKKD